MVNLALFGAVKLSLYLRDNLSEKALSKYEELLVDRQEALLSLEEEEDFIDRLSEAGEGLEKLFFMTGGNPVAVNLLYLCALLYMRPEYEQIFKLMGGGEDGGVTLKAASLITGYVDSVDITMEQLLEACDLTELVLVTSHTGTDILKQNFKWDDRLTAFVDGSFFMDRLIKEECEIYPYSDGSTVRLYGDTEFADRITGEVLTEGSIAPDSEDAARGCLRVIISGQKDSGRHTHARYVANGCRMGMLSVRYESLTGNSGRELLKGTLRECMLSGYALCIRDIKADENTEVFIRKIQEHFSHFIGSGLLFLLTEENVKLVPHMTGPYLYYHIDIPSPPAACRLWNSFFEEYGIRGYDTNTLSSLVSVNAGQLEKLAGSLKTKEKIKGESLTDHEICRLGYQILDDGRYENVHRIEPGYTLNDLKIDEKKKAILQEICDQVRYRHKVYDQWGMREKYAYGRSVSVLIAGPPGTGKTMAVHAIADELGLEMYKVDLSQVVDKYIGETEKRLEEVFKKAQKSNMVLFFDEADAVMGKRTGTSDAHDKSSNSQIAFILQRIEEYDGIVILATNLVNNIDSAFMRRIKYAITFDYPSPDVREQIWRSSFAKDVPLSEDVDFEYLAQTFEISGAVIKNIVLNATFYAAAGDCRVSMEHIMRAIERESSKDKAIISRATLGKYEYLIRGANRF